MLPAEEKLKLCRECRLPARLRDQHFLALARRDGQESLKHHILRELGKEAFEQMGGESRGVMDWIRTKLAFEARERSPVSGQ